MSKRKTIEQFINEAKLIHENKYNYSKFIYDSAHKKGEIICGVHGSFWQTANSHLRGAGCRFCGFVSASELLRFTKEQFVVGAIKIHGDKYSYDNIDYINNRTEVNIFCNMCYEFFSQQPTVHIDARSGCPKCGINRQADALTYTKEEFIERAKLIHGDKYNYDKVVYEHCKKDISILCCKCDKLFWQLPDVHINRKGGCTNCFGPNVSNCEIAWLDYLNIPEKFRKHKYIKIGDKKFNPDAIDRDNKIIWEFDGDYFHGNPNKYSANDKNHKSKTTFGQLYQKTLARNEAYKQAGYTLIQIWESDWNKIKKELKKND